MNLQLSCSIVLLCLFISWRVSAQATTGLQYPSVSASQNVSNSSGIAGGDSYGYARMVAEKAALSAGSNASMDLVYPSPVPTNKPTYIRIDPTSSAFTNNLYEIRVYKADNSLIGHNVNSQVYYTPDGRQYLIVSPSDTYKKINISLPAPIIAGTRTLDIYDVFYGIDARNTTNPFPFEASDCGAPNISTINVPAPTLIGGLLTSYKVNNPSNAIDSDLGTSSSFVTDGLLSSGSIKQTFYFSGPSNASDGVRVILSQSGSFLSVNIGKSITVTAYNGTNIVGSPIKIETLLAADLLTALDNKAPAAFYLTPAGEFDRVEVELNIGLLGLGLGSNGINIHDVRRAAAVPTSPNVITCTNIGSLALVASNVQSSIASLTYRWYSSLRATDVLSGAATLNLTNLTTIGEKTYYVESSKSGSGCIPSDRQPVKINVKAPGSVPGLTVGL